MANAGRNAGAEVGRHRRRAPARGSLWGFLDAHLEPGMSVAVLGAGNGDDPPLRRIAARAGPVTLLDLDAPPARSTRRRLPWRLRRRVEVVEHDVTGGAADEVVIGAARGEDPGAPTPPEAPLPGAPCDLAIGDLLYSRLLFPALLDLRVDEEARGRILRDHAPHLTRATVARLHASAPLVVHVHDPLAWWRDTSSRPTSAASCASPRRATPRVPSRASPAASADRERPARRPVLPRPRPRHDRALARPFVEGVDYLACATLARRASGPFDRRVIEGTPRR